MLELMDKEILQEAAFNVFDAPSLKLHAQNKTNLRQVLCAFEFPAKFPASFSGYTVLEAKLSVYVK